MISDAKGGYKQPITYSHRSGLTVARCTLCI